MVRPGDQRRGHDRNCRRPPEFALRSPVRRHRGGRFPGPGQIRRTDFMEALGASIERVAEAELAAAGHSARDCPYLAYWLHYYRDRPAADIERAIQRYAQPDQSGVAGLSDAVLARVRRAVQAWIRSGGREVQAPGDALVLYGGRWDGGQPLDSSVRGRMEQGLGENLRDVGSIRAMTPRGPPRGFRPERSRPGAISSSAPTPTGRVRPAAIFCSLMNWRTRCNSGDRRGWAGSGGAKKQARTWRLCARRQVL